jgi:predicted deacylase
MHGDEVIGPHALLYAYKFLKAYRIIYFPMVNPSGFSINLRETSPGKVDPNRDYPVDGNSVCYRTTATRIIDMLFRKYRIDLTVALHNGGSSSEVGFSWGTNTHNANSHTEDYPILIDIAKMLQRQGGESRPLGLTKFRIGTMDEVVYPASGTFDDWAYAVGKFPQIITKCNGYSYEPYP